MYKLKKGNLRTIIFTEKDLEQYTNAGWKLEEETKVEEVAENEPLEEIEESKIIKSMPKYKRN